MNTKGPVMNLITLPACRKKHKPVAFKYSLTDETCVLDFMDNWVNLSEVAVRVDLIPIYGALRRKPFQTGNFLAFSAA